MDKELRILILEDVPTDAELMKEELQKGGILFTSKCVETREDFIKELKGFIPDLILSDYTLSQFDGMAALELTREIAPAAPLIMVTGPLTEETAVECIKSGAADYVLKHRLSHLVPAVENALKNRRAREEKEWLEEALWTAALEWRAAFDALNDPLALMDPERRIQRCNKAMAHLLGRPFSEIIGRNCCELVHGKPGPIKGCPVERMRKTQERETLLLSVRERWFNIVADPMFDENKNFVGFVHIMSDVTERKQAEKALQESEQRYRQVVENAVEIIYTTDSNGNFTFANSAALKASGYTLTELRLYNYLDLVVPEHRNRLSELYKRQFREKLPATYAEFPFFSKSRDVVWFGQNASLVMEEDRIVGFHLIARDITERKQAEEKLRQSEKQYRLLAENATDVIWTTDTDLRITYISPSVTRMLGYTVEEFLAQERLNLTPSSNLMAQKVLEEELAVEKGEEKDLHRSRILELEVPCKDGSIKWTETSASFIRDLKDNATGILGVTRDITERKGAEEKLRQTEEQLRQSQKMEAMGRLAGGIAHDFNNLLTIIRGYSQLFLHDLKKGDPMEKGIEQIEKATHRAADLIRQLLAFSRRQVMEMRPLDLNNLLSDLEKMLRRIIGEDIVLANLLAEDLGRIKADPGQIEQVLINLVVNARDAMPSGGKITIETAHVVLDEEHARDQTDLPSGPYVELSISDTGIGMAPEVRDRIFEPFFTTKEKGKGTGLGLSTVYGIVKQSGGDICVFSEPGKGTTFKIYLPIANEPLKERKGKVVEEKMPRGKETILIVEDFEEVRELAVEVLERQGYKLLKAGNGNETLQICKGYKDQIHLMVTDVVMPGMSGRELADRIKSFHPGMKILYTSGYADDTVVRYGVPMEGVNYLQKPFTMEGLARKVREVLDDSRR